MRTREQTIQEVLDLFTPHARGAGDYEGVKARVHDYMKKFIDDISFQGMRVLDCGAGDAYTADYLKPITINWIGINKGIDLINTRDKYNILDMDFHFLDFPRDSFDLVLAVNVLEHSFMPAVMLYELRRVVSSTGYIFLDFPLALCDGGQHCNEENPDHHYLMSLFMWEKMFKVIGLEVVKKGIYGSEVQYLLKKCEPIVAS